MSRTDFDGYGITELRRHAREMRIPGRTAMSGPELLTAVTSAWDSRRVAAEQAIMPAVRPGAFLRFKSHPDCVIKVTSHVLAWTDLARQPNETTPLYVEAVHVSMCSNCDRGTRGGQAVTEQSRLDFHNAAATGANGSRAFRFMLWSLEPASAKQTADALEREVRPEPRIGDPVVRVGESTGPVGVVTDTSEKFAAVSFADMAPVMIRKARLTVLPATTASAVRALLATN